jgi:hypothetical protein
MSNGKLASYITLDDLYNAYKKAKQEAFYEKTHFHAVIFTQYEQALHSNLQKLHKELTKQKPDWFRNPTFLGGYSYLPKSIDVSGWNGEDGHFCALHPTEDWKRRYNQGTKKAQANFRLVITPTVDFQIVSALWIIKVGYLFYKAIDKSVSYANRVRELSSYNSVLDTYETKVNLNTPGLFTPYFSCYREWRENGLTAMQTALEQQRTILAITMDVEQFYHRVSPDFILRDEFLKKSKITLTKDEIRITKDLLSAINYWYRRTPDYLYRPEGAIPVGLSASKIISNVLMNEFDCEIKSRLKPIYYGRYVDDIFLVIENSDRIASASEVTKHLAKELAPLISIKSERKSQPSLLLNLPYAQDSQIIFRGKKQKIFALSSKHGLDLIQNIKEQIRSQSSEYRLLPSLPETGEEMASRALLATPDATLQADALRKADAISIRRLGLTLLVRDIEAYADDLDPKQWNKQRHEFYELVSRHALTPQGFFDYFGHIPRVFGIMIASGDLNSANSYIDQLCNVIEILQQTIEQDEQTVEKFRLCIANLGVALRQSGLQAATELEERLDSKLHKTLKRLKTFSASLRIPPTLPGLRKEVHQILLADWGRRPYKEHWYFNQKVDEIATKIPRQLKVRHRVRIKIIRKFVKLYTNLKAPYWPSLAFPTRPLNFTEIGLVAPEVLENSKLYKAAIMLFRGARVIADRGFGFQKKEQEEDAPLYFLAPKRQAPEIFLGVMSYETALTQWARAAKGNSDRSPHRYKNLITLINRTIEERNRPSYIIFPELSIPRKWAIRIANKLSQNNVSLISGIEYYRDRKSKRLRNDCLISLVTNWPGYKTNAIVLQSKFAPAVPELAELKKLFKGKKANLHCPAPPFDRPQIYIHGDFCFSVFICSDLTNIAHRNTLRGHIDCLFASEWNQDIRTFSPLVESTANDLHSYVVQVNNRQYGDSRIRAPFARDYMRDVVQVKGGLSDYYVVGHVAHRKLRSEQANQRGRKIFKPTPIGYVMSKLRRKLS